MAKELTPAFRQQARYYTSMLFLAIHGSVHAYLKMTEGVPDDRTAEVWHAYNQAFDEEVIAPLLAVLEQKPCGVAELCLAALKLLEIAGQSVSKIEEQEEDEQPLGWFVPAKWH
ncbi:MAG: hypothetical protein AB1776_06510 [Bacillota bacterium]